MLVMLEILENTLCYGHSLRLGLRLELIGILQRMTGLLTVSIYEYNGGSDG